MKQILLSSQSDALLQRWEEILRGQNSPILMTKDIQAYLNSKEALLILLDISTITEDVSTILQNPQLKVFALTGSPQHPEGIKLLKSGVSGYGNSFLSPQNLMQAIDIIQSGQIWLYPELMQHLIFQSDPSPSTKKDQKNLQELTTKEKETAIHISKGLSNKEVATLMNITERTVKAHLSTIYQKLQIKDRLALALFIKGMDA